MTGYNISHNTTGISTDELTNDTIFNLEGLSPGYYLFVLGAVNALGDGEKVSRVVGEVHKDFIVP